MENWNQGLVRAAKEGNVEDVKVCLQFGADINYKDNGGLTSLMYAADRGHLEVTRQLILIGCDKEATTDFHGVTAMMLAARGGQLEVVRLLIDKKCNKDVTTYDGKTALHLAAKFGHLQVTRYLVEHACISPLATTHQGKSPYDLAAEAKQGKYKEVMAYLEVHIFNDL
ncbi:cyclin-dependent kinase 4 inhibitor C-like [Mytilus edulis]|uniref:cyclin-dependent kinase 4 inhibitor C-like n=1 Tax=Mytilus edulis TaxID=6550 RepID=UPI0039F01E7D